MNGLLLRLILPLIIVAATLCGMTARHNAEQWDAFYNQARSLYDEGHYDEALEAANRSLAKAEGWLGLVKTCRADSLNLIALCLDEVERFEEAQEAYRRSLLLEERSRGKAGNPDYAVVLDNFAASCNEQGRYEQAAALAGEAFEIWNGLGNVRQVRSLITQVSALNSFEDYEQAAFYAQMAVQTLDQKWPQQEDLLVSALHWQGDACYMLDRYEEAEAALLRALELSCHAALSETVALTGCLADARLAQGRTEQAEAAYLQTVAFLEQLPRNGTAAVAADGAVDWAHPDIRLSDALTGFGNFYLTIDRYDKAAEQYLRVSGLDARVYGANHYYVVRDLNDLGVAHELGGNYTQATDAYLEALALLEQWQEPDTDMVFSLLQNLADCYEKSGRLQEAAAAKKRMYALVPEEAMQPLAPAAPQTGGSETAEGAEALPAATQRPRNMVEK